MRPVVMVTTARIRGSPSGIPSCTGLPSPIFGGGVGVIRRRRGEATAMLPSPSVADYRATSPEDGGGEDEPASLSDSRQVAADGGALHEALVFHGVVVGGAVQDGAVVPQDRVALAPGMGEPELGPVGALAEFIEQRLAGRLG